MMTMIESAARHLSDGVDDINELARLVEADTGRRPGRVLMDYRSRFRRYGKGWVEASREAKRESNRGATRRWIAANPAMKMLSRCVDSARKRGHECTITVEMIEEMLAPMTCAVTGLPLKLEHSGNSARNPWAPSIDRIDCSKGYVPGNVRVVCWAYNTMRSDFPDEVVLTLAKALVHSLSD